MADDDMLPEVTFDHRSLRRVGWAKWLLLGLLGLVVLVGVVLLGLNTDPGRRFVAQKVAGLEFANGMKIGIGRIDGSLYGQMTVRDLTLSDTKGIFIAAPEVRVDWRPFAYARNHIDIRSLIAPTMSFTRIPQFKVTAPSNAPLLPDYDIDIDRLKVERLVVGAGVAGQPQTGTIDGTIHIADRRAQVALKAATIAEGKQKGGDRLDLRLDAVPEKNRLALGLAVDAPGDGVIAALAGIKDPLTLRVDGRGDWTKWDGHLDANLKNAPFARLALTARDGRFGIKGPTRVATLFTGPTAALLGPILTVDASSTWVNRRADVTARLASDAFTLTGNGRADLGGNRLDQMRLSFALLKPGAIAPNLAGRDVRVDATLDGPLGTPNVDYAITATSLAFNDMALERLQARGVARFANKHLVVPVGATAARITGLDVAAGGTITNVRLDGDLAVDWPRIVSDNIRLRADRIDAKAIVLADVAKGLYTGAIDGRVNNYRVNSVGVFNIDTKADVKSLANGGVSLVGKVRAQSTQLFNNGVRNFLGGNLVASSDVAYGPDGIVRFSRLRLAAPLLSVTDGRGSYAPSGQIALNAVGQSKTYGPVGVEVSGTVAAPHAVVTAAHPGLGLGIAGLKAEVRSAGGRYRILASGGSDYGAFTADVLVNPASGPLQIAVTRANIGGIDVHGNLRQTAAGPFAGRLDARGQGLGGVVRLAAAGRYQQADLNLRANHTVLPGPANLSMGGAIVDARVILYDRPEIVADAQVAQLRYQGYDINAARVVVEMRGGRGFARVLAEGNAGVPFRVALNADLQPTLWRAAIQGRASGVNFRTASPARIVPGRGGYELLPTTLTFDQGSARLAGRYGPGITLQARLDSLDLALVNSFSPGLGVGGKATGVIDFVQAGDASLPRADLRLAIRNFTRSSAATVSQPVDINLIGELQSDRGDLKAVMRTRGTVIGRLQAQLDPLGPGAGGWTQRISGAPVHGGLRYIGPADTLFSFAGLTDQRLAGPLGVAADFSCRVSQPCLQGVVRGRGMTYENLTYGTKLTGMTIAGRFTGERLEVDTLTAQAGSGTVTGKGYVSLAAASGYPGNFDLKFDNARLANSDDLSATATGSVQFAKAPNQAPVLSGTVRLPSTRYEFVRQNASQVPELTGVRFKPPRGRPRVTGDPDPQSAVASFGKVGLDLKIIAPNQLFVSGMGLESEWRSNVTVTGTSDAPRVAGQLDVIRGTLAFAGRSFDLQDGHVNFTGAAMTEATLNLTATSTIEDVDVTLTVTGTATNPQIAFSSTPGLPQDEIISRILFGSSVGNLSAIQAVQLAASLNSLRGSGGGLNPLGKLRTVAGIDRLRILGADDTTGRGTALAAGKYISKNIYLEVVTDAKGFTATQLEVTLSKALSILSQAGGSNSTNVSVRYRKNY